MPNPILTDYQSIINAQNYRDLVIDDNATYVWIGRITPWTSDTNPPDPAQSLRELEFDVWRTMAAAKKVQHIEHMIPAITWSSGVVWDMYDDAVNSLINDDFYTLVEQGETKHIFKCLYNNDGGESTEKPAAPTGTDPDDFIIKTSDGYVWFYMYQINDTIYDRYASGGYVPAVGGDADNRTISNDGAVDGKVYFVEVTAAGSGYGDLEKDDLSISSVATASRQITIVDSTLNSAADFYNGCILFEHNNESNYHVVTDYTFNSGTNTGTFTLNDVDNLTTSTNVDIRAGVKIKPTGDTDEANYEEAVVYASLGATGSVEEAVILNGGEGYSFYTAEINSDSTSGSGAEFRTIFAPEGGHGSNFIKELFAIYLTLTVDFEGNFNDKIYVNNDFRQYGILHNPTARTGNLSSLDTVDQRTTLTLTSVSDTVFSVDEEITGDDSGAVGRVVSYDASTGTATLEIVGDSDLFELAEGITGETSGATATISTIMLGELKPFSGNVLYMKNLSPIARTDNQIESIRITLAF